MTAYPVTHQPELRCCYNCKWVYADYDGIWVCDFVDKEHATDDHVCPTDVCEKFVQVMM